MTDCASLCYVVVDVEGNGQQPSDIVELAAAPSADGIIGSPGVGSLSRFFIWLATSLGAGSRPLEVTVDGAQRRRAIDVH